jgi:hypothetical protein
MKNLNDIQSELFEEYIKNGYLEIWTNGFRNNDNSKQSIRDIAELGLVVTEVAEAMEEIRQPKNEDDLFIECADIIIRVLNFMTRKGANAEYFISLKNKVNLEREKLHGKEV